ncbi:MAG: AAA family ATPase [Desulfovibrionaceae bacterium]|jgi:predicted ATPase|nr:AAA family ATPase [Desulfovibrionaceae bacterium]
MKNDKYLVLTGGPGSGKTAVINGLAGRGFRCAPETGRAVIREQVAKNGTALPWLDRTAFRDAMLERELTAHAAFTAATGPVFFDRGIIDVYGYSLFEGLDMPEALLAAATGCRYNRTVCILPPWKEIFSNDAERRQDFEEAVATHAAMAESYARFGYELVEVPKCPVRLRVEFILEVARAKCG